MSKETREIFEDYTDRVEPIFGYFFPQSSYH